MKLIIAGGRDYCFGVHDHRFLEDLLPAVTEVVSGGAPGADACGERWAKHYGIPVRIFEAAWDRWGNAAGPRRNAEMARHVGPAPDGAVVLFPGGRGTNSMYNEAVKVGCKIYDRREADAKNTV